MMNVAALCLCILLTTAAFGQSAVPATLNQIHHDPAQTGFEKEYDDLQKTVRDLDKPGKKQTEQERESKLPSHKVKSDEKN